MVKVSFSPPKHNYVTIMVDASYSHNHKVAGYGAWVASNLGKFALQGEVKHRLSNSTDAEFYAALQALDMACNLKAVNVNSIVLIQTDCQHVVKVINGEFEDRDIFRKEALTNLLKRINIDFAAIRARHVKGHTSCKANRSLANAHCDARAKSELERLIKREKSRNTKGGL